jgi:hypothetical protein
MGLLTTILKDGPKRRLRTKTPVVKIAAAQLALNKTSSPRSSASPVALNRDLTAEIDQLNLQIRELRATNDALKADNKKLTLKVQKQQWILTDSIDWIASSSSAHVLTAVLASVQRRIQSV